MKKYFYYITDQSLESTLHLQIQLVLYDYTPLGLSAHRLRLALRKLTFVSSMPQKVSLFSTGKSRSCLCCGIVVTYWGKRGHLRTETSNPHVCACVYLHPTNPRKPTYLPVHLLPNRAGSKAGFRKNENKG